MITGNIAGKTAGTSLFAVLTVIGVLVSGYLPILGSLVLALAGVPALLVSLAWGGLWFLVYFILTVVSLGWLGGWASGAILVPMLLAPAALFAFLINSEVETLKAVFLAVFLACGFSMSLWMIAPALGETGTKMWAQREQLKLWEREFEVKFNKSAESKTVDQTITTVFLEQIREWVDFVSLLIPFTFLFVWHLLSVLVFYFGGRAWGAKFGIKIEPFSKFSSWKFDWNLIWLFAAGWFLFYMSESFLDSRLIFAAKMVGANLLAISKILYLIMGFSLLFWMFEKYQISVPNRIGLSFLVILFYQVREILVWFGIIDVWADFRAPAPVAKPGDDDQDNDDDSFF
ncbi:MAG: DUF2232 domain-containing protein [Candidatus Riflebacteria bacterium]|nr:DUF2232 domain-containing protein [Candidatus Riflebacteria bacterium]